jgi:hypothetical protein
MAFGCGIFAQPLLSLESMADLNFSQPERPNFLVPALIAVGVLGAVFALVFTLNPHRVADLAVTHIEVLPTHTVLGSPSNLVGAQQAAEDEFYVLTTIRIDDKLRLPLFIKDLTGTLTTADGSVVTTSAVEENDLPNLYSTFPALKPLASTPLLRETEIPPGQHAEGMVLLHFPVDQTTWDQHKSAIVTIDLYHQDPITVEIPKP